ncbi:MAG: NAD-dependent epimerase/dehydratase family protein [Pseudomonadota bacterium]
MSQESTKKLLLLGFGDIARRLVQQLPPDQFAIKAVRRRSDNYPGVESVAMDCTNRQAMVNLLESGFDIIVITMTPAQMSDAGYKQAYVGAVDNLIQGLNKHQQSPQLIIFVSSTSVYGQTRGEWVDENSVTEPKTYSGKRLLEAETLLSESHYPTCCVRFSGIYGPGRRRLIEQVLAGHGAVAEPVLYSNRIHANDGAGILAHLIVNRASLTLEPIYLASDCEPSPLHEVKYWLAEQLGLPKEHLQPKPLARSLRSSKRCSNQKVRDLGYQFRYPTYRQGYKQLLDK